MDRILVEWALANPFVAFLLAVLMVGVVDLVRRSSEQKPTDPVARPRVHPASDVESRHANPSRNGKG